MIRKRNNKYVLLSTSTGRVLGTHDTKAGAEAQETAINISEANKRKRRR